MEKRVDDGEMIMVVTYVYILGEMQCTQSYEVAEWYRKVQSSN